MIEESFVSFETAKKLKEKGFDEPCQYFYKSDSNEIYRGTVFTNSQIGDKFYNAPTLWMVCRWLREMHKIFIQIELYSKYDDYKYEIFQNTHRLWFEKTEIFNSPEEACKAAIKYCLENLILNYEKRVQFIL